MAGPFKEDDRKRNIINKEKKYEFHWLANHFEETFPLKEEKTNNLCKKSLIAFSFDNIYAGSLKMYEILKTVKYKFPRQDDFIFQRTPESK